MFDVSGNVEFGALLRFTPVEEQRPPPNARDRRGQRHLLVEIQNPRRIYEGWDKDCRRACPAMIAQARTSNARHFGL